MYNSSRAEDFHVKNISVNTILQLCENDLKCQPKLEDQRYSCKFLLKLVISVSSIPNKQFHSVSTH